LPLYPQQLFVAHTDDYQGLAILNKGLPEYEILNDRVIALSLLRAVGHVGRPDLTVRPGRVSGIDKAAPQAQMQNSYTFEYAVEICNSVAALGATARAAKIHAVPIRCVQLMATIKGLFAGGGFSSGDRFKSEQQRDLSTEAAQALTMYSEIPTTASLMSISPGIEISAVKQAEIGNAVIVRCYNPGLLPIKHAQLEFGDFSFSCARLVNLREQTSAAELQILHNKLSLPELRPGQAITVELSY